MLIEDLFPAVHAEWPQERPAPFIQQDNAKPHLLLNDPDIIAALAGADREISIQLMMQPANSPDFNILNLCFFRSLPSLSQKRKSRNMKELIENVEVSGMNMNLQR
jgi:hypothetical protein